MKTITLNIPDRTFENLSSIALYDEKTIEVFAKEVLLLAEREIWKTYERSTEEMLQGLDYFNKHRR